jgi:transmembrane sensor
MAVASCWEGLASLRGDSYSVKDLIEAARKSPDDFGNVITLNREELKVPEPFVEEDQVTDPSRRHWLRVAASLGSVALAGGWLSNRSRHQTQRYTTAIGEQRRVVLPDRSVMFLNTDSGAEVRWSSVKRQIDLVRGEGRFEVTHDPSRPFVVAAAMARVRALGTVFDVRVDPKFTRVAVVEGNVQVTPLLVSQNGAGVASAQQPQRKGRRTSTAALEPLELHTGDRAALTATEVEVNTGPPVEVITAWAEQRLIFRDEELAEVVREFNRYKVASLVVEDPNLSMLRINGVFDLRDPGSLVEYLRIFEHARVRTAPDGTVYILGPLQ